MRKNDTFGKLGIYFIVIGLAKLTYHFICKRRDDNANR